MNIDDFRFDYFSSDVTFDDAPGWYWRNCETGEKDGPFASVREAKVKARAHLMLSNMDKELRRLQFETALKKLVREYKDVLADY